MSVDGVTSVIAYDNKARRQSRSLGATPSPANSSRSISPSMADGKRCSLSRRLSPDSDEDEQSEGVIMDVVIKADERSSYHLAGHIQGQRLFHNSLSQDQLREEEEDATTTREHDALSHVRSHPPLKETNSGRWSQENSKSQDESVAEEEKKDDGDDNDSSAVRTAISGPIYVDI